jgi:hypothetical protein
MEQSLEYAQSIAVNIACPCKKLCICDSNSTLFIYAKGFISAACGAIYTQYRRIIAACYRDGRRRS